MSAQRRRHVTAIACDADNANERFTIPIRALTASGTTTGTVIVGFEQADIIPGSTIVLHASIDLPSATVTAAKRDGCRIIYDIDDRFVVAKGNGSVRHDTNDCRAATARKLASADSVTVSNALQAAELRKFGCDPKIIPSVFDPADWTLQPRREERLRARLGWYGRPLSSADAGLIQKVVGALIAEADFVFFGKLPLALMDFAPRVECAAAVPFALLPTLLAAYDLDIVLVPPAVNAAMDKTNDQALLHAGMLGYAVITSDHPVHATLAVTPVLKKPRAWIAAIRERLHDVAAVRHESELLCRAVRAHFLVDAWTNRYREMWAAPDKEAADG